jgi:hypothetical protein
MSVTNKPTKAGESAIGAHANDADNFLRNRRAKSTLAVKYCFRKQLLRDGQFLSAATLGQDRPIQRETARRRCQYGSPFE